MRGCRRSVAAAGGAGAAVLVEVLQVFFRGANFSEFHVGERDGKLVIQMCRGWIDHAEPILTGNAKDPQLERLNLDWNCLDKSHEA